MGAAMRVKRYVQVTDVSAAVPLPKIPPGTYRVLIQAEAQNVRWRDDGVDPTSSVGTILAAGSTLEYAAAPLTRIRFIESTSGAKLNVTYYGDASVLAYADAAVTLATITCAGAGTYTIQSGSSAITLGVLVGDGAGTYTIQSGSGAITLDTLVGAGEGTFT